MTRVHLVPHTHWDREWYHTAATFQPRLARLIDDVAAQLSARPGLPSFLLDGQAVTLADYADARPAQAATVRDLLAAGRLECGPWFVLPDELLVSAEALVRNLLEGGKVVARHGGAAMRVGYSPDAFGHSGALPAILRGFGIDVAVAWRGVGGEPARNSDLLRWAAADGSEVLLVHLPAPGYGYGANLPTDPRAARRRWTALRRLLEPRARTPHWLVLVGADHHALPPDLPEAARALQAAAGGGVDVALSSLTAYADAVRAGALGADLPAVAGELRGGRRHAWSLQGTHGSRLVLKRWNAHVQRLLERVAEPLAALARVHGGADLRADLDLAWRALLLNHPHDSLCGTSSDAVHREMLTRFRRARDVALETIAHATDGVTAREADRARAAGRTRWRPSVVVFNPSPQPFRGVIECDVARFRADVPVGQGTGPARRRVRGSARPAFELRDTLGRPIAFQVLERRAGIDLVESPRHYPDCDAVEWVRVAAAVEDVPALGVAAFEIRDGRSAGRPVGRTVRGTATTLESEQLFVRVEESGTLEVVDRASGGHYRGMGGLAHGSDRGDSYTSSPRGAERILVPSAVAVRALHPGPLRGALEVVRRFEPIDLDLTMRVSLDAGSPLLEVRIGGVNRRQDHRLRLAFPSGASRPREVADGHFGPVERAAAPGRGRRTGEREAAAPTAPMQRYVSVARGDRGLTVLSDGLPEYETTREGTVLVTLLRAFGELSRADLPERPGHAGWPMPTPDAQQLGPFAARLGVCPHDERALEDRTLIEAAAEAFHAAPFARCVRATLSPPPPVPGPMLHGAGLVFSAMKPAEDGRGIVLRCWNGTRCVVRGAWEIPWNATSAWRCRMDETGETRLEVVEGRVQFEAGPRAVVTIRVV